MFMSTDLSEKTFSESTHDGFLDSIFDRLRIGLRDAAKSVRMEAAWRTWPTVHKLVQPLHEALITEGDRTASRQSDIADLTRRLELTYPTPDRFPAIDGDIQSWRHSLALNLGITDADDPSLLDDVIAAYEAKNGHVTAIAEAAEVDPHEQEMDGWTALNQAVGGDLWTNPAKAAVMRRIDAEMTEASWEDFHNAVVTEIAAMPQTEVSVSRDIA